MTAHLARPAGDVSSKKFPEDIQGRFKFDYYELIHDHESAVLYLPLLCCRITLMHGASDFLALPGTFAMRIFKKYIPLQVAKYVKTFFRGRLYISGKGGFMFDSGRLVAAPSSDACHQSVVNEVNGKISELSAGGAMF